MGLDSVELLMEIEDDFAVSFTDEEAVSCQTIGDTVRMVETKVATTSLETCRTRRVFYELRRELLDTLPLTRRDIRPASRFEDLIPLERRRQVWRQLENAGFHLPSLSLPPVAHYAAMSIVAVPFLIAALSIGLGWAILGAIPLGILMHVLSRPWATSPRHAFSTLGGASEYVAFSRMDHRNTQTWSRNEIAGKIRSIVSEQLGVPFDQLTEETRYVEDLKI